jgi:hypothetical protein
MSGLYGYLNDHLSGAAAAIRLRRAMPREGAPERARGCAPSPAQGDRGGSRRSPTDDHGPGRYGQPRQAGERRGDGATRQPADGAAGARAGIGRRGSARLEELEVLSLGTRASGCSGRSSGRSRARTGDSSGSISPASNVGPSPSAVVWNPSGWSSPPLRSPVDPSPAAEELTPDPIGDPNDFHHQEDSRGIAAVR